MQQACMAWQRVPQMASRGMPRIAHATTGRVKQRYMRVFNDGLPMDAGSDNSAALKLQPCRSC